MGIVHTATSVALLIGRADVVAASRTTKISERISDLCRSVRVNCSDKEIKIAVVSEVMWRFNDSDLKQ
jgi:hypothetical protein